MLIELIDRLDEAIGAGASAAKLRAQLSVIREHVEAVEAELQRLNTQFKELQAKVQTQNLSGYQDLLEEGAKQLLIMLFNDEDITLEEMAHRLRIKNNVVQYHADSLVEAGMIELSAAIPSGVIYILTPKGRAYVVRNELA